MSKLSPEEREAAKQKVRDQWASDQVEVVAMTNTIRERKAVAKALENENQLNNS
jgi:hypothetical protein